VAYYLKLYLLQVLAIIILFLSPSLTEANIGKISQQTGPTEIVRNNKSQPSAVNSTVQMSDTIVTAKSNVLLDFEDNTQVKMTEHSKLLIDEFVYDPNKGTGKLGLKVALGTARYASGQIAKNNPQTVNVKTPTATIAVRGTDFSMTVDELGRSLVILLPSCDDKGCVTGAITVSNESGTVLLDIAYQATLVSSLQTPPTEPKVINVDQTNINNLLIVAPPIKTEEVEIRTQTTLDINYLNQDLLKYSELDKNYLENIKELDLNLLDNEFLGNMLDISLAEMMANQVELNQINELLPKFNAINGIKYFFNDDKSKITLTKNLSHIAQVTTSTEQNSQINIIQDGVSVQQQINQGGTTSITIIQK
jgi:hypothetical protein